MSQWRKVAAVAACMAAAVSYGGLLPMASATAATTSNNGGSGGSGNVALTGNTDSTLLSQSSNLGPSDPGKQMDISVVLKAHDYHQQSLAQYIQSTEDPSSANYHQFLSASQFTADFAPSSSEVQSVKDFLTGQGLTVTNTFSNNLVIQATGSIGAMEKTFNVAINQYQHGNKTFDANTGAPQVPSTISNLILGITGLTTFTDLTTNAINQSSYVNSSTSQVTLDKNGAPTEGPGQYGPAQVRSFYNINPLYKTASGAGETIGIATLANFNPSDAYTYWKEYGVSNSSQRITEVPVDGGFPVGVHQPGAGETTLDVEQSGSMAPSAHIDVYEAPNTNPGFIDLFYTVAADDQVSVMSTSWGEAEQYETPAYHQMMNQAFQEGAAEGISMFASSGDSGAYDAFKNQNKLAVDSPASDPYITAAGGTAYPANLGFTTIPQERVWGWDYLLANAATFGLSYGQAKSIFYPVGGGGGVSSTWAMPWYQQGVSGMNGTGRNVPDISLNADPFTGYSEYDTFGPGNTGWETGWGGTSFVAPQLAGITALMDSSLGTRLGLLNPMLYQLAQSSNAYGSSTSPFHDITAGDNWYYNGVAGYDDGSGIGSLNVANLDSAIAGLAPSTGATSGSNKHGH